MKDFYYILGTDNKATPGEINAAYRKLAQKLQPAGQEEDYFLDTHFQDITEAYILLSDPVKRRNYDIALKKHYQRRLYFFKIGHVNVLTMLALILFTALFGYYVMKSISGDKTKKTVIAKPIAVSKPKHRKKKRIAVAKAYGVQSKVKSEVARITPPVFKPQPVAKQVFAKVDTVVYRKPQPAPVTIRQPVIEPAASVSSNTVPIKANQTGMVYLHQTASYTSPVLANIPNNAQVQVLEKGPVFCKISFSGQTGYVPKWTIPTP